MQIYKNIDMYRLLIFGLICNLSFNVLAQDEINWVGQLDSISFEKDFNKKIYQLDQAAQQLKVLWSQVGSKEIMSMATNLSWVKSEDGEVEVIAFGADTRPGVVQLCWLVKENMTGEESVWLFKDEVKGKGRNNGVRLSSKLTYDMSNDLYQLSISSHGGTEYVQSVDLMTKCWFEKLFKQVTDESKDSINTILSQRLNALWKNSLLYDSGFESLKRLKTISSQDEKVKICTYNITKEGFVHEFYGAVIIKEDGVVSVYPLDDRSEKIRTPERSSLSDKKWYGAIYLDIIDVTDKKKTYYTLLGYKGYDEFVKTRVVDVLTIRNDHIRFGSPIFKMDKFTFNRVIYHYSAGTTMMMRYDKRKKMIVMDNLVPTESFYRGVYRFYGPDFTYNGFKFQKGYWQLEENIDLRNLKVN